MKYSRLLLVGALAAAASSAQAAGIGLRAGTTGVGADFGFGIVPTLGGRIGLSGMNINTDVETSQMNYDAKAKLANLNLLLDWSPLGPFRISAGFIANNNKVDLSGQPRSGSSFPAGTTLDGTVKPEKDFAPYLGIGYGNVWTTGVNFYFDLGVMFQGSPQVSLRCQPSGSAQCTTAQPQIAAEQQRVQDKLDKYKYYPVLNLGITIGF
jgi:hypothetical protein